MAAGRPKKNFSLSDIGEMMSTSLTRASTRPTVHNYVPHEKQITFHKSTAQGRLYIGGNRSGKTVGGIVEDIFILRGQHPYREVKPGPVQGRIVTVSYIEGIQKIVIPELSRWLPPSDLINGSWEDSYSKSERTLMLSNGSSVELMSYDQKLEKFAGTSREFVHFDEEPPKDIFTECKMRLIDTAGCWYITMTPVEGMTWVYDDVYEPGLIPGSGMQVIIIDTEENPYISNAEIETALSGLDANEKKARKEGKFVQLGGLAFKAFTEDHVFPDTTPPLEWTHYISMDHGLNNPTCFLWHAVSPSGAVITYDEIHDNERLVHDYAKQVTEKNGANGRRPPDIYVADPAIAQRNGQTGDSIQTAYAMAGLPFVLGNNDVKIGVEKMNRYLQQGRWVITGRCPNLIRGLQRGRWKVYENAKKRRESNLREELVKKDDHATDSARYFFGMMPDLYIPPVDQGFKPERINNLVKELTGAVSVATGPMYYDKQLVASLARPATEWETIDEHMGGIW